MLVLAEVWIAKRIAALTGLPSVRSDVIRSRPSGAFLVGIRILAASITLQVRRGRRCGFRGLFLAFLGLLDRV